MTAVLTKPSDPAQWGAMPGWNIVADMTPPELINARSLAGLRRRIVIGLVMVALVCGAGYAYAVMQHGSAADAAVSARDQTDALTRAQSKYSGITRIETTVSGMHGQLAGLMTDDVDVARLSAKLRAALPNTMSIQNLSITLTPADASAAGTPTGLDASGRPVIGKITISGSGRTLDDLPSFVDRLAAITGVIDVLPSSNQVASDIAQFSVTASLSDQLYSHYFDVNHPGGR